MGKDSRRLAKKESRRRRRIAMACARRERDTGPPPTSIHDVPDDLLELILLRVRTPFCLFRAAAACKPWRRVVCGAGFLRRFRALHGPRLLLGHYRVNPMEMEHRITRLHAEFIPSPPASHHLRRRLSLDSLPQAADDAFPYSERVLTDSHGGLLAFVRDNWYAVVYDPWTRQHRELRFPWGQDDSYEETRDRGYQCIGAFLLDAGDDADVDFNGGNGGGGGSLMSSFRVLCACLVMDYAYHRVQALACVFSARHDHWLPPCVSTDVGDVQWSSTESMDTNMGFIGRAGGYIFWFDLDGNVLALDEGTGEFTAFRVPEKPYLGQNFRVVRGEAAGTVPSVRVVDKDREEEEEEVLTSSSSTSFFSLEIDTVKLQQWQRRS